MRSSVVFVEITLHKLHLNVHWFACLSASPFAWKIGIHQNLNERKNYFPLQCAVIYLVHKQIDELKAKTTNVMCS